MDETRLEDKVFAPGYGEFHSGQGDTFEATSLAVPADARPGPAPAAIAALARPPRHRTAAAVAGMVRAWRGERASQPPRPGARPQPPHSTWPWPRSTSSCSTARSRRSIAPASGWRRAGCSSTPGQETPPACAATWPLCAGSATASAPPAAACRRCVQPRRDGYSWSVVPSGRSCSWARIEPSRHAAIAAGQPRRFPSPRPIARGARVDDPLLSR